MRVVILHYTAPPVIGGVEAVIAAHTRELRSAGYSVTIIAGRGTTAALSHGAELVVIPEMDTRHPEVLRAAAQLERGQPADNFSELRDRLTAALAHHLRADDVVIVHNIFTKHFNLPLTAALFALLDRGVGCRWIAWGHDFTWTSPNSRAKVFEGEPWDWLRRSHPRLLPVVVSQQRQSELAGLYGLPAEAIRVVYNGVDPQALLGLTPAGLALIERLDLFNGDLNLLMPVRVTQAKNIELALRVTAALKRGGLRPRLVVTGPPDPHDAGNMDYFRSLLELRAGLGVEGEMRFVYEAGPEPGEPLLIGAEQVGELYRVSDALLMLSHREGFGMPVLEAGLAGLAVFSTAIPAAREIGGREVIGVAAGDAPEALAQRLLEWAQTDRVYALRRRVRQEFTWPAIFRRCIEPLLQGECLK
jgi:glycosyltransferase involved in cell wall biosynthesis